MIIVADENIARAAEAFAQFGEVRLVSGRAITHDMLMEADALVVRSITPVNRSLLEGTPVRFVGTATIGTDHIDFDYLNERAIGFADAAGGGARSVAEYVVAALLKLRAKGTIEIAGAKLGIVGAGAIGSMVADFARSLGMATIEHDPPRAAAESEFTSAPIEAIYDCDVIILAVPLTHEGDHATHHMVDDTFLAQLKQQPLLINTARGGVVRSEALLHALETGIVRDAVLDVWEEEPDMPVELLKRCSLTTPHIAGYSQDGKLKGTEMMAEEMARHFGLTNAWNVRDALPLQAGFLALNDLMPLEAARIAVKTACDIERDSADLRAVFDFSSDERVVQFDRLRKNYPVRREFPAWHFSASREETKEMLTELGFVAVSLEL